MVFVVEGPRDQETLYNKHTMKYQIQIHNGTDWMIHQEVYSEHLAYRTLEALQGAGAQARVMEYSSTYEYQE